MTRINTGIFLPAGLLTSPWFITFSLFVALNTLIYLGLTAGKLLPWPDQIHPRRVRAVLPGLFQKDPRMNAPTSNARHLTDDPYRGPRLAAAAANLPHAFALTGGLIIVVTLLDYVMSLQDPLMRVVTLVFGVVFLGLALVLPRIGASGLVMGWIWSLTFAAFIIKLAFDAYTLDSPVGLTYAAVALALIAPISMAWAPALVGGGIGLIATAIAGLIVDKVASQPWIIAASAAFVASLVLLQLRLNLIDGITREQLKSNALVTTDPLTGLLGRVGLLSLTPSLLELAQQAQQPLRVTVCRIERLGAENREYGWAYGDAVLTAVGRALRAAVPSTELVARWTDTQFISVGVGPTLDLDDVHARFTDAFDATGITLGKRPVAVKFATTAADARDTSIETLVEQASANAPAPPD